MLLDPSGERALSRGGRSPSMVFGDKDNFVAQLKKHAGSYEAKKADPGLPTVANLRLGINVAASDGLPLVAVVEKTGRDRKQLTDALAEVYQQEVLAGQAHFVVLEDDEALRTFDGFEQGRKLYVLQPDTFARNAKVITTFSAGEKKLAAKLQIALTSGRINKASRRDHVRQGRRAGISWKSAIPVTDGAANAREGESRRGRRGT